MILPPILEIISKELTNYGARAILVGGAVRDSFLNLEIKDYDIEVYGLDTIDELESILLKYGQVNLVGKSFGILKFNDKKDEYDFSFPRLESKVSKGHRGFKVICDGNLDFKEASRRRDFTINAMGYDIISKEYLDPFNGLDDIKSRTLRAVESRTFIEDPLRVYRAVQFSARFNYSLSNDTKQLCLDMVDKGLLDELPKERVYEEFKKLLLKSSKPSVGFNLMAELGIVDFNSLKAVDRVAKSKESLEIILASLLHKLDKDSANIFLYKLTNNHKFISSVVALSQEYSSPYKLYNCQNSNRAIRELATRVNISKLLKLIEDREVRDWLYSSSLRLGVLNEPLKALISGKDLISLGIKPSPKFKEILKYIYQLQLNGDIASKDEALEHLKYYNKGDIYVSR